MLSVVNEVAVERFAQVEKHGRNAEHDDNHDRRSWAWYLGQRVHNLACPFDEAVPDERRQLIEIAAIAVAAVEAYDRRPRGSIETNMMLSEADVERLRAQWGETPRSGEVRGEQPAPGNGA